MLYLTHSQVPELSGFNRKQRRFLLRAAMTLQWKDDPWFRGFLALLFGGWMGACVGGGSPLLSNTHGITHWVILATIGIVGGIGGGIHAHLQLSHLRPFLREAIRNHGAELDDIG